MPTCQHHASIMPNPFQAGARKTVYSFMTASLSACCQSLYAAAISTTHIQYASLSIAHPVAIKIEAAGPQLMRIGLKIEAFSHKLFSFSRKVSHHHGTQFTNQVACGKRKTCSRNGVPEKDSILCADLSSSIEACATQSTYMMDMS